MKNTYYFPHDYHARHDPKLAELIFEMGSLGSGIYWNLVEMLYENNGYLDLAKIPLYAQMINTDIQSVEKIINKYKLFSKDDDKFYSHGVIERLKFINTKRRKAMASAKKRWDAFAKHPHSKRYAIKKSKVKKSKVKNKSSNTLLTDLDFLNSLKANTTYKGIDVEREQSKCKIWCETNHKTFSRRRLVNWLNRIDKPISNIKPEQVEQPDPNCDVCHGSGKLPDGELKGARCLCVKMRWKK